MATYPLFCALACLLVCGTAARAQTLLLCQRDTGVTEVEAEIGDVVDIEVHANLGRFAASGVSLYISIPRAFDIVDTRPDSEANLHPFQQGPLFAGAAEADNALLSADQIKGLQSDTHMLSYIIVVGAGKDRARSGHGVIARFQLLCTRAIDQSPIKIASNPIRETRLVLADG